MSQATGLSNKESGAGWFPAWTQILVSDAALSPGLRESYQRMIRRFLAWCQQQERAVKAAPARDYVELERLEHAPGPVQLQEWKDALNWLGEELNTAK